MHELLPRQCRENGSVDVTWIRYTWHLAKPRQLSTIPEGMDWLQHLLWTRLHTQPTGSSDNALMVIDLGPQTDSTHVGKEGASIAGRSAKNARYTDPPLGR